MASPRPAADRPTRLADAPTRATELVRPGPPVLEADSWLVEPTEDAANESYHGRRRARSRGTRLLVGALVLAAVGGAIGIPWMLRSPGAPEAGLGDPTARPAMVLPVPTFTAQGELSATSAPGSTPTPTARRTTAPRTSNPLVPPVTSAAPPTPTVPPFEPLSLEAEASGNTLSGSADAENFANTSGGRLVRYLGKAFSNQAAGSVRFNNVTVPTAGTYSLTFFYVSPGNWTAHISVNGNPVTTVNTSNRSNCCGSATVEITLAAGTNTITFGNPNSGQRCPAIDRIVISET
jgi:hypothetical protein